MEPNSIENPAAIINTLQRRIDQLEDQLRAERNFQLERIPGAVEATIQRLRLYGIILLQLNPTDDELRREQQENSSLKAALGQSWLLDRAPVQPEVKGAIRRAVNNGMSCWE